MFFIDCKPTGPTVVEDHLKTQFLYLNARLDGITKVELYCLVDDIATVREFATAGLVEAKTLERPLTPDNKDFRSHELAIKRIETKKDTEVAKFKIEQEMKLTKELMQDMTFEEKKEFYILMQHPKTK